MSNPIKKFLIISLITIAGLIIILSGSIYSWVTDTFGDSRSVTVGEVTLDLVASPETEVSLNLTSPTFLLDPQIISLYDSGQTSNGLYLNQKAQFKESCSLITFTLKNTGNVNGVIGYGSGDSAKGISLALIDKDITDSKDALKGLSYVLLPHNASLYIESDYYTHLLDTLSSNEISKTYSDFNNLVNELNIITNATIANTKTRIFAPNEEIKLDLFIWQEYYDGASFESQYDNPANNNAIFTKQDFSVYLKVYFGQTGIK